jgi:hypothetical protein
MSNESNVRYRRSKNNPILLSVLLLGATLNTSQAMVLCEGSDGHVAIEPVGWNCYAHTWQTDALRTIDPQVNTATCIRDTRCLSCVDTPIGGSACDKPRIAATPGVSPADSAVLGGIPRASGADAAIAVACTSFPPAAAPCAFLSSIVLRI